MLKISKQISTIVFIVLIFIIIISNAYEFIYEALEFKKANENKARENLSALIKWSENEGKEELKYAKNLSKETYNQEKVTQMIIKNLKMIQASIEDMKTLIIFNITDENVELMRQAGHVIIKSNMDIILYLMDREKTFIGHQTYFLFDKERFDALEDFLLYLNTNLEDFLEKGFFKKYIDSYTIVEIGIYINMLITYNRSFAVIYPDEFPQDYICNLNNSKTITILNGMSQINTAIDKVLLFLNQKSKIYIDDDLKGDFKKAIDDFQRLRLNSKEIDGLKTIQNKLKECTNE
ncbi:hypothetical protein [Campylobacter sp. US33a]|uniref:hypothetical protein n=1 Tax=Campylobacter sp. US33a TaxID=2498120 RepID=UPI001067BA9D|nr:hypothetical protein [Campylobacter sp. US33a]TEY01191.1 hypothetical protein ELQ16_08150 [Campylobacter sp. US33a]